MTAYAAWTDNAASRDIAAVALAGAFLTFTNPFGATSFLPWWGAFLYWALLVGQCWLAGEGLSSLVARAAPQLPGAVSRLAAAPVSALIVTATILVIQNQLGRPVPLSYWPTLYGLVLGICFGIALLGWLVARAFAGGAGVVTHAPAAGAVPARVRFLDRLPPKLRGAALYAVAAEDHYLRLHTSKGSDLILMRLSDALSELEGLEGAQTHRSWWVARDAVRGARRDGVKLTLLLKGDLEAPVSRPNVKPLRDAGWY